MTIGLRATQKLLPVESISAKDKYLISTGSNKELCYLSIPGKGHFYDINTTYPTYEIYIPGYELLKLLSPYLTEKGYKEGSMPEWAKDNHKWFYPTSSETTIDEDEMLEYLKSTLNLRIQHEGCTVWL
jgi:hypothetical protein